MIELEEFLNNLNKIEHLNNNVSQLVYTEKYEQLDKLQIGTIMKLI